MWLFVHITFLTGFKNRLAAMFHWAGTFLMGGRAERTITLRQVIGRVAIEQGGGDDLTRHLIAGPEQHDDARSGGASSITSDATALDKG
jgi:NADH:ubiquinone reductase (H+-translocating)